jgi:putative ABC transport system permease protein
MSFHPFLNAWRMFRRNRLFTGINILGLSIGISASLVIYLIADHEFSYDRFEQDRDRVYKVVLDANFGDMAIHSGAVPAPLGQTVGQQLSGIELTIPLFRFQGDGLAKVSVEDGKGGAPMVFARQPEVIYVDPTYFQLMPYKWLVGRPAASITEAFNVVLTESRARLYFPGVDPADVIGRHLTYNGDMQVTISGIVADLKRQSALAGLEFISMATINKTHLGENFEMTIWKDWMAYSELYLKLVPGVTAATMERQLADMYRKHSPIDPKHPQDGITLKLLPLSENHFNSDYQGFRHRTASKTTLYGLLAVAAFLLLLACLNFINLSTAQAVRRAREIGIRKTMGSSRSRLIRAFIGETLFLVVVATALSIVLVPFLLSTFAGFIPPDLHASWLEHPGAIVFLLGLISAITLLAGFYPAYLLSGFNPVAVLKDGWFNIGGRTGGAGLRKIFIVSQFVIAQFFIIATLLVGKQMHYSLNSDLGFRKEAVMTFGLPFDTVATRRHALLTQIRAMPEVEMASMGFMSPGDEGNAFGNIAYKPRPDVRAQVMIRWGDSSYIPLYQIKLLAGRNVRQSDTAAEVLINATYATILGFRRPEDALNKRLTVNGHDLPIVGVMADFHEGSMHSAIGPLAFYGGAGQELHVRFRGSSEQREAWQRGIQKIQKAFGQIYSGEDWDYSFVDDVIAKWYKAEQDLVHLLYWATGLTILISCLGLLGLVIYTTNMRTREIGIRKVLGAPVGVIVALLSGEFVRLVALAFGIAVPIAYWAANHWLQGFAYRTALSWWVFAFGGLLLLLVALLTLSFQTIKAALANPARTLRSE